MTYKNIDIFTWNDDFKINIEVIDKQHYNLVFLLNNLAKELVNPEQMHKNKILQELTDYTLFHFKTEEHIWNKYLKNNLIVKEHIKEHKTFIKDLTEIKKSTKTEIEIMEDIVVFLVKWLALHILEGDKYLGLIINFLNKGYSQEESINKANIEIKELKIFFIETILSMHENLTNRTLDLMKEFANRKAIEKKLSLSTQIFNTTLDAICVLDQNFNIIEANKEFLTKFSNPLQNNNKEITNFDDLKMPLSQDFIINIKKNLKTENFWSGIILNRTNSGEVENEWLTLTKLLPDENNEDIFVANFSNVSKLLEKNKELERIANHDALTNLPNRLLLREKLLKNMSFNIPNNQIALCYLDLNKFKEINDSFGHNVGDQVLIEIAKKLKDCTRETDTVARIGGDEFVIVFSEIKNKESLIKMIENINKKIEENIIIEELSLKISASLGICLYPENAGNIEELSLKADLAMYEAKNNNYKYIFAK